MNQRSQSGTASGNTVSHDALRTFRHELRTPVNHLLGYTELLIEDAEDQGDEAWHAALQQLLTLGRSLLEPIGELVEAIRNDRDTESFTTAIQQVATDLRERASLLATEVETIGYPDAADDLMTIEDAATRLIELVSSPFSPNHEAEFETLDESPLEQEEEAADILGRILVVDDNPQNREILSRRLSRLGHDVAVASGGKAALELLGEQSFDLVLLDVMMPDVDGYEVLATLKQDATLRELPVIMLSALDEIAAAVRCIEMGADDYLPKPVDAVLLRARIGACLERKRLRDTEVAYLRQASQVTGPSIIAHLLTSDTPKSELDDEERSLKSDLDLMVEWIDMPKGSMLFAPGDASDCMFIVASGRFRLDELDDRGHPRHCGEVRRGETLGELDMLTGAPRSMRAVAVRDAWVARLTSSEFRQLASAHPRLLTRTTSDVIDRLRDAFQRDPTRTKVTTYALVPVSAGLDLRELSRDIAEKLAPVGSTLLLDRVTLPDIVGVDESAFLETGNEPDRTVAWLNDLEMQHRFVLYVADTEPGAWTQRCLRQADHVVLVGKGRPDASVSASLGKAVEHHAQGSDIDLLLLHDAHIPRPAGTRDWLEQWPVRLHHHHRLGDDKSLNRLVRRLTGRSIDVVFGGGGARGWAHTGVIRAMDEAGIPIDAIAGTSMGSLIGAAYLVGMDWQEIRRQAMNWGSPKRLFDYTLPLVSVISGNKITTMLQEIYEGTEIEDLWRGFFCVSSSLTNARPVVHRQGPTWKAVRASISLPAFLPPVSSNGELLIDGSYLNNLPTDFARDIFNSGTLIAVNVSQAVDLSIDTDIDPVISGWSVLRDKLLPGRESNVLPSPAATLLRASSLSGTFHLGASIELADYAIIPDVSDFGTLDFAAYDAVIEAGYQAAVKRIETWDIPGI